MQCGNPKPFLPTLILFSIIAIAITFSVWVWKCISFDRTLILFLNLEGTALLACSFTPSGQLPAQGNFIKKLIWFFKNQSAVPVIYNRPLFYGGLICLSISFILNTINDK